MGREPAVVVIGGGTGLSTMLRGLKLKTGRITAIVTVADDGGSSGRIRSELGIPPPGDIRNTLVALANTEPLMEQLFQYRFNWGEGLEGHSFGNLFIAAMTDITGDFEEAIRTSSQVLAVRGEVLPSTLSSVTLRAEYDDGSTTTGESLIPQPGKRIRRVFLEPEHCKPLEEAITAINNADAIVLGPGSLYTSVLPNLLVPEIREAIRKSTAPKIYICNVMTQPGETDGYKASNHVEALLNHVGPGLIDYVIVNTAAVPEHLLERYRREGAVPVEPDVAEVAALGVTPITAEVISMTNLVRHDPEKLAEVIYRIITERTSFGKLGKLVKSI
ncbi:MAG: YvcK family protein [Firmicutes bacterium]|nr:YvcK family protein [Bacillota bacterium]